MNKNYEQSLWNEISRYGDIVTNIEVETHNLDFVRVRVFNLGGKLYWITQLNGKITKIQEIGKA